MTAALLLSAFAILLVLSACNAPPPPPAPEPEPVAVVEPEPPAPVVNHAPAAAAVKGYRRAEASEAHAVTAPTATADSIADIRATDKAARHAAAALVAQNGRPTPAAIAHARRTLDELTRAVEAAEAAQ